MKKLAVLLCLSGTALLSDPLPNIQQITIDFSEFVTRPSGPPINFGTYYNGGTSPDTKVPGNGPDWGITGAYNRWMGLYNATTGSTVGTFALHGPGEIDAGKGLFNSVSLSIAGGLSSAPAAAIPITVLDSGGAILGEADVAYTGGLSFFETITIPFAGQGAKLMFGNLNSLDAGDYQFSSLVTWVDPAASDPPGDAPEPRYLLIAGVGLLLLGTFRKHRMRFA